MEHACNDPRTAHRHHNRATALPARHGPYIDTHVRFRPRQPEVVSHGRKSWDQYFISRTKAPATTTPTKQPPATAPAREATSRPPQHPPRPRATRTCDGSGGVQERGKAPCERENVKLTTFIVVPAKAETSPLAANGLRRRRPAGAIRETTASIRKRSARALPADSSPAPFGSSGESRFQPTPRPDLLRLGLPHALLSWRQSLPKERQPSSPKTR